MSGNYHYAPTIWSSLCTVVLLLLLSVYAWRRRSMPGALPFAIGCLLTVPWSTGIAMEYAAVDLLVQVPNGLAASRHHRNYLLFPGIYLARALADPPQSGFVIHCSPADPD